LPACKRAINRNNLINAIMNSISKILLISTLVTISVLSCQSGDKTPVSDDSREVFVSPLGKELPVPEPSPKMLNQYAKAKQEYESNPDKPDNIIWYGRRTAYLGRYEEAIKIYSEGIQKFPANPRFYRHRGHRYISLRKFDLAIKDFEKAGRLIEGAENEIEPDGMPNAMNIPVSTLHGNIWYHLGLAYYLKHDYERAYAAYTRCRDTGSNDDNLVSSTHWLYMIQRRLGNKALAEQMLEPISEEATIIENTDYYRLCKFYKGLIPLDSILIAEDDSPSSDAVKYGLANWYFYNGEKEKSRAVLEDILDGKSWTSFGYIAAESDMLEYFKN
jgi:tetratricopeptide (TPR) repeat protein